MFALRTEPDAGAGVPFARALPDVADRETWVLPKWLRRPARLMKRLNDGEIVMPRFAASALTAAFLGATGLYGAYVGGHMPAVAQAVTARTGFAVDEIRVVGHKETSEIDILGQLGLDGWTALVGFNAEAARERVAALPWVEVASVRKVYPDEIEVRVREREPFAIWQHGRELSVIEKNGRVIVPFTGGHLASLPQVIGEGAQKAAAELFAKLDAFPQFAGHIRAFVRVGERRWDLVLDNGVTLKLPEAGEEKAIAGVLTLDRESDLLGRDIAAIDMRLGDRLVVQLTPEAMERRTAELEAQAKARKKAGRT